MSRMIAKLKSQRGASILLGLLLFLVCVFVAGATLSSAYGTATRSIRMRQGQQDYLAVASAAELMKNTLSNTSMVLDYKIRRVSVTLDGVMNTETTYTPSIQSPYTGAFEPVSQYLWRLFRHKMLGDLLPATNTFDLSFALDEYPELSLVKGTLTIDEDYNISALLYSERDGVKSNAIKLTLNAGLTITRLPNIPSEPIIGEDGSKTVIEVESTTTAFAWGTADLVQTTV